MTTSSLSEKHPDYSEFSPDWTLMRDAYRGERQVKGKGVTYLPMTSGHIADGIATDKSPGMVAYKAYRMRARFPGYTREAVQIALGMLHTQDAEIELPTEMENIRSSRGETMQQLLMRINKEQLLTGRVGLMADLPIKARIGEDLPYLALYNAERIINWDNGKVEENVPQSLNMVVLDETEQMRVNTFSWETDEKYRVLVIGAAQDNEGFGVYRFGVFKPQGFDESKLMVASYRGNTLDYIPFWFINATDHVVEPEDPPLLDLANLCMTIYRGEADYRQNLFMQGQDTFVTIGANIDDTDAVRTGAGARLDLPQTGDAKYVGVTSDGLQEQRNSLENDRALAGTMGAQSLDSTSRERESGKSLNIRLAARTADLNQIAIAGAAGLENALKGIATWIGADPEKVSIAPNMEFGDAPLTGQLMVDIAAAKNQGWPISEKTMHDMSRRKGLTRLTYEEESKMIEEDRDKAMERAVKSAEAQAKLTGDQNPNQRKGGSGGDNGDQGDKRPNE